MALDSSIQRIARLIPLRDIFALIDSRIDAVPSRHCALGSAQGYTLAQDVVTGLVPPSPLSLRDGFAVEAAAIADAGAYTPIPFAMPPQAVEVGEQLQDGADSVLPFDAVAEYGHRTAAIAAVTPGDGVLPAGGDATPRLPLRRAGERLRPIDIAVMRAAGIGEVVVRSPRLRIVNGGKDRSAIIEAAIEIASRIAVAAGARVLDRRDDPETLREVLQDDDADAVLAVGGTGSGRGDDSVRHLAQAGRVEAHGIAIYPGETAAFGFVGARPVLLAPGRLDAALAVSFLIGRHLFARLADARNDNAAVLLPLKRKIVSSIGVTELVPVRCADGMAEPLATGYLSLTALSQSDGCVVVPADSEGFAAGTPVAVRSWP